MWSKGRRLACSGEGWLFIYKSVQVLSLADSIDTVARLERDTRRTSRSIRNSAERMGLKINENNTKHVVLDKKIRKNSNTHSYR